MHSVFSLPGETCGVGDLVIRYYMSERLWHLCFWTVDSVDFDYHPRGNSCKWLLFYYDSI